MKAEAPNQVYGRLLEGVHVAGYTLERAWGHVEWLLEGTRWQEVGSGHTDVNEFIASIPLDEFKIIAEKRERIAKRVKALQPKASNRAIAKMVGAHHTTIGDDLGGGNPPAARADVEQKQEAAGGNPPALSGPEAARVVAGHEARQERKARKEAAKQRVAGAAFSDDGPFGTVVIDPPWDIEKIDRDVRPNQAEFDYPVMTEEQIIAFWKHELDKRIEPSCHLFLWTIEKYLPVALKIVEAIGFRYVLTMVWHKAGGFQPVDLPQYNCEFVVYARRGTPVFIDTKDFFCCFDGERREHSRKPDEFYDTIRRVTGGSRIDVFSREPRDGFAQYSNEPTRFAEAV